MTEPTTPRAIVIGASAGGIDALSVLLPCLPAGAPVSVFVVIHLPPTRPSLLPEIFQPKCAMAVREAQDKEAAEHATVYFAPPDYHLLIDAGPQLALSVDPPVLYSRPAIDVLFESAAEVYGKSLWGIVLSGASEDGAEGLAAVQRAGGKTLVQRPDEAAAPTMPRSALQRCPQAQVMSLQELGMLLRELR